MKCPICNLEAHITSSKLVMDGDKLFRRQIIKCRNESCPNFGKEIARKDNPLAYEKEGESDESKD